MKNQGQANFNHVMMFSFNMTILGGSIWTRKLLVNAGQIKVVFKTSNSELGTTITLKNFYMSGVLTFNEFLKLVKKYYRN